MCPRVADSPRSPRRESEQRKPIWAGGPAGWAIGKIKPELAHGAVGSSAGGSGRPSGLSRRPARSRPGSNLSNKINDFHIHFCFFFPWLPAFRGARLEVAPGRPRAHIMGIWRHIARVRRPGALAARPAFRGGRREIGAYPV